MLGDSNSVLKAIEKKIKLLEDRLKVKSGFFKGLLKEKNDWSFIIKIHSLVETAISHYLAVKIGNNKLETVFQRLPLSTATGGKIDFLKAIGLLGQSRGFIVLLSRIRNHYVHVVSNVSLRFEDYLDSNAEIFNALVNEFRKAFSQVSKPQAIDLIKKEPKAAIWLITMMLLLETYESIEIRLLGLDEMHTQ